MNSSSNRVFITIAAGLLVIGLYWMEYDRRGEMDPRSISRISIPPAPLPSGISSNDPEALQQAFVRNAKLLSPSVVSINELRRERDTDGETPPDNQGEPTWWGWFQSKINEYAAPGVFKMEHLGSGIIYDTHGHILTNYHVIENADRIIVRLHDRREYHARVVATDPKTDLAVIKIFTFRDLTPPEFGKSESLKVGEWVMAIGNPYGLDGTVTVGVVSGVKRNNIGLAIFENLIQTDAAINPGNSGGPLINLRGEVVGVNTVADSISAVGFSIPAETAVKIADELIARGGVERGWLGIGIQPLTPELASLFQTPYVEGGVLINGVDDKTPAGTGGIVRGDIILGYDGEKISGIHGLQRMVAETRVGKLVSLQIVRAGKEQTLQVKVGKLDH